MINIVGIVFLLLYDFDLLGEVFRIGFRKESSIGRIAKPVTACPQLIWEIGVIVFLRLLLYVFVSVSTFASEGEVSSSMLVSRLHVLIVSSISWKL